MKLAFFDDFKLGVVAGDKVVDVTDVVKDIPRLGPQDVMRGVIERFDALKDLSLIHISEPTRPY